MNLSIALNMKEERRMSGKKGNSEICVRLCHPELSNI
jgi:hypothetical protein